MSSATANTVALSADGGAADVGAERGSAKADSRAGAPEAQPNTKTPHTIRTGLQVIGKNLVQRACHALRTSPRPMVPLNHRYRRNSLQLGSVGFCEAVVSCESRAMRADPKRGVRGVSARRWVSCPRLAHRAGALAESQTQAASPGWSWCEACPKSRRRRASSTASRRLRPGIRW